MLLGPGYARSHQLRICRATTADHHPTKVNAALVRAHDVTFLGETGPSVAEAEHAGWVGEAEGLRISLAAAQDKLTQLDERSRRAATVNLDLPAFSDVAGSTTTAPQLPAGQTNS